MDFQKVLEALDHLIEKRVESAAYTRMLTAIVQDIENSEKNIYKVKSSHIVFIVFFRNINIRFF